MLKDILNHADIAKLIASEDIARDFIEMLRWPNGATCPHCQSIKVYSIAANTAKKVRKGLYKCGDCKKQFTVTVGTIFEDSRIPLNKWFHAIHLLCSSKKGFSSHQIHRTLGITYKSAWFMTQRIRYAMAEEPLASKLTGIVESDETFIGGKAKNMHAKVRKEKIQGRGAVNKEAVVTLVERGGNTQKTLDNVNQLTKVKYHAFGSIVGNLDAISVHKGNEFRVWDEITKKSVRCAFDEKDLERVKFMLKSKVVVFGDVQSNSSGSPVVISVEELEPYPQKELPSIEDMSGFIENFTEGKSLKEYMEALSSE